MAHLSGVEGDPAAGGQEAEVVLGPQLLGGRELQPRVVVLGQDDVVLVAGVGLVAGLGAVLAHRHAVGRLAARVGVTGGEVVAGSASPGSARPCGRRPARSASPPTWCVGRRRTGPIDLEVLVVGDVEAVGRVAVVAT